MRVPTRFAPFLVLALAGLLGLACAVDPSPRIDAVDPDLAQQGKTLWLHGVAFGPYSPGQSGIYFSGVCADVLSWQADAVAVIVPAGIGLGAREIQLVRADGLSATATTDIAGRELPAPPFRACELITSAADAADGTPDWELEESIELHDFDWLHDYETPPEGAWQFVRIDDLSNNDVGRNPGADIDAICVVRDDFEFFCAAEVGGAISSPYVVENANPFDVLGSPDAYPYWPDLSFCLVWEASFALGGAGFVDVMMASDLRNSDRLEVYEVGGCDYGGGSALAERYRVSIGRDTPSGREWRVVGEGEGPLTQFVIEGLDP